MANTIASLPGTYGVDWQFLRKPEMTLDDDGQGGYTSTVGFSTVFSNLAAFVTSIAGTSQPITTSFGTIHRVVQMQHPMFSGLYAKKIRCVATGEPTGTTTYDQMYSQAKVYVEFGSVYYGITGDQAFMSIEMDKGATYTTQSGRKFKFPGGEPIDQDAGQWAVVNNYSLTLYQVPTFNDSVMNAASGCVNDDVWFGNAAGLVLFGGCKAVQQRSVGGILTYQYSVSFAVRSYPWNQCFNRAGVLGTPLDPAGNPQYNTYTFNNLLS